MDGGVEALQNLMDIGIEGHYVEVGKSPIPLPDNSIDVAFAGDIILTFIYTKYYTHSHGYEAFIVTGCPLRG